MENHSAVSTDFNIKEELDQTISCIREKNDPDQMNWITEGGGWGACTLPEGITVRITRTYTKTGNLQEKYQFCNETDHDYFFQKDEAGIQLPLPDNYASSDICMKERCHVHIWCGGMTSYIKAVRMSGRGSGLGLVLTTGSLSGYSVIRNEQARSNDRGRFFLHPEFPVLMPGETIEVVWELFWFKDGAAYEKELNRHQNIIQITSKRWSYFTGEQCEIRVHKRCEQSDSVLEEKVFQILRNGIAVPYELVSDETGVTAIIKEQCCETGEVCWTVSAGQYVTTAKTLVLPKIRDLAEARCDFLVKKQQYHSRGSRLDGAFLIYDNEEGHLYYSKEYDHNGARERVGMGVLLAKWMQQKNKPEYEKALKAYTDYIYRELYDEKTGIVYNDAGRDNTWHRLYNYPWMALFFIERFKLYKEPRDLHNVYRILHTYYDQGGERFYAIAIPMKESISLLQANSMEKEAEELLFLYQKHGDILVRNGLNYPAHEVNYEQSIAAPAVTYLLELYSLTGENKYLRAGVEQLHVLIQFNGHQPDYHLFENAIRHWDGFWFGKRKCFGDTFPHYWSALTGLAYWEYAQIAESRKCSGKNVPCRNGNAAVEGDIESDQRQFTEMAENSLRGVLNLFFEYGTASCAYVYPDRINGIQGGFYDPWANDQDWGLYFYLTKH